MIFINKTIEFRNNDLKPLWQTLEHKHRYNIANQITEYVNLDIAAQYNSTSKYITSSTPDTTIFKVPIYNTHTGEFLTYAEIKLYSALHPKYKTWKQARLVFTKLPFIVYQVIWREREYYDLISLYNLSVNE